MVDLLLIHGSCHGAWCWDAVVAALGARGINARALDLPGRGGTATTLAAQARAILDAAPRPTLLVGHSAGGFAITAAAEADDAKRIKGLVYVCAYVPKAGQSVAQMRRSWPQSPLSPAFRRGTTEGSFCFDQSLARNLFFHDCPDDAAAKALARFCDEPIAPLETPLPGTDYAASLPRFALICTQDRAIPPAFQRHMTADFAPSACADLPAGHAPFSSHPDLLADHLTRITESLAD